MKPFYPRSHEIPILLSGEMTAIVRPLKRQPTAEVKRILLNSTHRDVFLLDSGETGSVCLSSPFGPAGGVLYGKESFGETEGNFNGYPTEKYAYKADTDKCGQIFLPSLSLFATFKGEWLPAITMPRSASRLWFEVKEMKVVRVQDITRDQAIAAGFRDDEDQSLPWALLADHAAQDAMEWELKIKNPYIWYCELETISSLVQTPSH
jgi:hypothetical protein